MSLLFDRKYRLTIGHPDIVTTGTLPLFMSTGGTNTPNITTRIDKEILKDGYTKTNWQSGSDWIKTDPEEAALITDLQITANIAGSSNTSGGTSSTTISIFNMSDATRDIVELTNNYVILEAGYAQDEELKMIFSGQVTNFETKRRGQDLVTILQCSDAYTPNNSVRVSKYFPKTQTYADLIEYLITAYKENGVPLGEFTKKWESSFNSILPQNYIQLPVIKQTPANTPLVTGYSMSGYLHQVLTNICNEIGYVNYIANGKLFIHPKGYTKTVEQYEFTSDQMKSIRKSASQSTNSSLSKGVEGVVIHTFLDGRLDVDKRIEVVDGEYKGTYKIITKAHQLDYLYGNWDTMVTCKSDTT